MTEHGNGRYGTRVTYNDGKVNTFWCTTTRERNADYKQFKSNVLKSGIKGVSKVERNA